MRNWRPTRRSAAGVQRVDKFNAWTEKDFLATSPWPSD
jgi:hypothetical protein